MGGKKGGGSRTPKVDKNTLNSAQKLKIVDIISSGEISGFINGSDYPLKSVYLNDTPVQNSDGSMNHAGVQFEFNRGALDQDYLPSVMSIDNAYTVGTQVEKKSPITRTVMNQQVTSVRVTVGVDALMRTTKEGDQLVTSVDMSIQILKNGNVYAAQHMHLNEKGSQPFHVDYVFSDLPPAPFDIRCVRVSEDSKDDMLKNNTFFFSYVESIDVKVRMPGTAVAMLQIDSQQFGNNNPVRTYGVLGAIVQVPSNYDAVHRTYSGLWDRLFKPAYTNNPAWILYDLLTNETECFGDKFRDYQIDIDKLYELSKYCDEMVDDGSGGKEPRFICNIVLLGGDASTVLDNICSIFRGTYSDANNQFTVHFDKKIDAVAVYNNSNVIEGEFNYSYVPSTELYNQVQVEYIDKEDGYRTKIDEVSDEKNISIHGIKSLSITAYGCTKRSYALRCAKWNLVTSLTENETIQFGVGASGIRHEQHDIIKIADNDYAGASIGGRIESVDGVTITLDREIKNVKSFTINSDGQAKIFKIAKTIDAKTYQLTERVNAVDYAPFVATLNNVEPRLFRCVHIAEDSETNTYTITAIKHNPQKEAIVDKGASYIESNHSLLNPLPHLSNGIAANEGKSLVLRWDSLETAGTRNKYIVHLYNGTILVRRIETLETFVKLENLPQGNYTARIRAINEQGMHSAELSISFSTTYEISGLRFNALPFEIHLFWQVPSLLTTDAVTEIWLSKTNDLTTASLFAKTVYPQSDYRVTGLSAGEKLYFWLRIVDTDGNQGEFTLPIAGEASIDGESIISYLKDKITATELGDEVINGIIKDVITDEQLLEEIKKATDESLQDLDDKIASEVDDKLSDLGTNISTEVAKEIGNSLADLDIKISTEVDNSLANLDIKISTQVTKEVDNRLSNLDEKVVEIIDKSEVILKVNERIATSETELQILSLNQASSDAALTAQSMLINAKTDDNQAQIQIVNMSETSSDHALSSSMHLMKAENDNNIATIKEVQEVFVNELSAQSQVASEISTKTDSNAAAITQLDKVTTDKFTAQAQSISKLDAKIGTNTSSISTLNKSFTDEKSANAKQFSDVNTKVGNNESSIKNLKESTSTKFDSVVKDIKNIEASVDNNSAEIQVANLAQVSSDSSLSSVASVISAKTDGNTASITKLDKATTDKFTAQAQSITQLDAKVGTNTSGISTLNKSFTDEKSANAKQFSDVNTNVGNNKSSIKDLKESTSTKFDSVAKDIKNIEASVDNNSAEIQVANLAQVSSDNSLSSVAAVITAKTDGNTASITKLDKSTTDKFSAQAQSITQLDAKVGTNTSGISTLNKSFTDEKLANAKQFSDVNTNVGNNKNSIKDLTESTSTKFDSVAKDIKNIEASVDNNSAEIQVANLAQVSSDNSLSSVAAVITAKTDGNTASITKLDKSTTDKFSAQAQSISKLDAKVGTNTSGISTLNKSFADEKLANAQKLSAIDTKVAGNTATIKKLDDSTSTEFKAVAKNITQLETAVEGSLTQIQISNLSESSSDQSLSSSLSAINAKTDGNTASITKLDKSTTDKFSAQAQSISKLDAKTDNNTASITQVSEAVAGVDGNVKAMYTLSANANGVITGIKLGSDGKTSIMNVMADSFVISNQVNGEVKTPFILHKNKLALNGDLIATGSISGDKIIANTVIKAPKIEGGSLNIGNGRFKVSSTGEVNIVAEVGKRRGLQITSETIRVFDENGVERVKIGKL